jgi:hypothetical protein
VFYGTKYVVFHCTTAFFGVICLRRPQWVLIWKAVNEVLEELGLPLVGRWDWTESLFILESRYDTLINDMLLVLVPFAAIGLHLATVLELPDPLPHCAKIDYVYVLQLRLILLQHVRAG